MRLAELLRRQQPFSHDVRVSVLDFAWLADRQVGHSRSLDFLPPRRFRSSCFRDGSSFRSLSLSFRANFDQFLTSSAVRWQPMQIPAEG